MATISKQILLLSILCLLMLVSIPLAAADYHYPPENGPYQVSVVGTCDGGVLPPAFYATPNVGIKIGPFYWFTIKDDGPQFNMWNGTIFKINGKQQNYTLRSDCLLVLYGFKGYGPIGFFPLCVRDMLHVYLKLRVPTRIYGTSTEIYAYPE